MLLLRRFPQPGQAHRPGRGAAVLQRRRLFRGQFRPQHLRGGGIDVPGVHHCTFSTLDASVYSLANPDVLVIAARSSCRSIKRSYSTTTSLAMTISSA